MSRSLPPFRQRFLGRICAFKFLLYLLLSFQIVLLLLNSTAHFTAPLPPETQTIVYLNFILLIPLMTVTLVILYVCGRFQADEKLLPSRRD